MQSLDSMDNLLSDTIKFERFVDVSVRVFINLWTD